MDGQRRFAVIGTDARLAAAGRALARAGFAVGGPEQTALADYILLPLPLDESRTPLAELLRAAKPGALALGGKLSAQARQIAAEAGVELVDYFAREELILCNAIPTAEGCIGSLMAERTRTLWNSAILLAGFGPVGQALGVRLAALGAQAAGVAPHRDLEAAAVLEFRDVDGSGGADVAARAATPAQRRVDFDPPAQAVGGIRFSEGEGVGHRALLEVVPKDFEEFHISPPSFPARWRRLRARLP